MNCKSNTYVLAKYDVSGIQRYIFATNRLRENVGASFQVTRILEEYLPASIKDELSMPGECVLDWERAEGLQLSKDMRIKAEIIYIGGGNAIILFRDKEIYQKVCQNLGRRTAEHCQGVYVATAYIETSLQDFKADIEQLDKNMTSNKAEMIRQPIYSPFPVVEQDNSDYQPITRYFRYEEEEFHLVEDMTEMKYQKWTAYQWLKNHKNKKLFPAIDKNVNYEYPVEMDSLCQSHGEDSYIAVVHIDGNGMGNQIQKLLRTHQEYIKAVSALREKSKEISNIFSETYKAVLLKLQKHMQPENGELVFPLRPIVLDGDDFTFLCKADIAIPIATGFLTELSKSQERQEQKITACAGIAFVHSHFPFYEAYNIAEQSCSHAKEKWYEKKSQECSYLDFQVVKGSEVGGIKRHENLEMRPYAVTKEDIDSSQDSLIKLYKTIKEMEAKWPSNRLHKIYKAMLEGIEEMKLLDNEFISRGYQVKTLTDTEEWWLSPLFDALEARGLCDLELLADCLNIQKG